MIFELMVTPINANFKPKYYDGKSFLEKSNLFYILSVLIEGNLGERDDKI